MTAVLTVKSGMDPHMIRGLVWIGGMDGLEWLDIGDGMVGLWLIILCGFGWYFTLVIRMLS